MVKKQRGVAPDSRRAFEMANLSKSLEEKEDLEKTHTLKNGSFEDGYKNAFESDGTVTG